MRLKSEWFGALLVSKELMHFVYAITTREMVMKNNLLSGAILSLFNAAYVNHQTDVMKDCAKRVRELGVAEINPFEKIVAAVEAGEKTASPRKEVEVAAAKNRLREELDEEAYYDSIDEEEETDAAPPVEPVRSSFLPSFEGKKEEEFSLESFLGADTKSGAKKGLHIDVKLLDTSDKRVKLDS